MTDRSLRGSRLVGYSLQDEQGVELAERVQHSYRCADGSEFQMTFAADAEIPTIWPNPSNGQEGVLIGPDGELVEIEAVEDKSLRTHWDMLLERRTMAELEEILQWRIDYYRSRRGGGDADKLGA